MSPRRLAMPLAACAALAAALIAGCGGDSSSDVDPGPAAAAPQNAPIYVDATVKPTGAAQTDVDAALGKVLDTDDPGAKIVSLIDQEGKSQAAGQQFTYAQDIAPWLGEKVGFFFTTLSDNEEGAAIIETSNTDSALAFARKVSGATETNPAPETYNGVSYQTDPEATGQVFG